MPVHTPLLHAPLQQSALVAHEPPLGEHMPAEHTPFAQIWLQQSVLVAHIEPSGKHIAVAEHTPPEQMFEQHSADWTQAPPLAVHAGSFGKSTPTATMPLRCISRVTWLMIPASTDATTGSLTHVALRPGFTPAQLRLYAAAENVTAPRGIPETFLKSDGVPGGTSKDRVTVRVLPCAVSVMHRTSPGTVMTASEISPVVSGSAVPPVPPEHPVPAPTRAARRSAASVATNTRMPSGRRFDMRVPLCLRSVTRSKRPGPSPKGGGRV
jgi:hypothetical protein